MVKTFVHLYYCGRCGEFYRAREEIIAAYRLCLRCGKQMMKLGGVNLEDLESTCRHPQTNNMNYRQNNEQGVLA